MYQCQAIVIDSITIPEIPFLVGAIAEDDRPPYLKYIYRYIYRYLLIP
jgi:hypothetical protein